MKWNFWCVFLFRLLLDFRKENLGTGGNQLSLFTLLTNKYMISFLGPWQLIDLDVSNFDYQIHICCCFLQAGTVEKIKTNIQNSKFDTFKLMSWDIRNTSLYSQFCDIQIWRLPSSLYCQVVHCLDIQKLIRCFLRERMYKRACLLTISYISLACSDQINSTWLILTFLSCFFRPHSRRSATTATASNFCPGKHVNNDDHEFQEINQYDPVTSGRRRTGKNIFLI